MADIRRVLVTSGGRVATAAAAVSSLGGAAVAGVAWWALTILAVVAVVAIASACVLQWREVASRESIDRELCRASPRLVRAWAQLERARSAPPGRVADGFGGDHRD